MQELITPTKYDCDYFIQKFEAIPESEWFAGVFDCCGMHCAMGHCGAGEKSHAETGNLHTEESSKLKELFECNDMSVYRINDGFDKRYTQPTPKLRILAALHDIKAKEAK